MEDQWLTWAKRLQAIASSGLHFGRDDFDRERYAEVGEIAQTMLATLGQVPIERIQALVGDYAKGYATPKIDVRGAVIRGDEILLVRERMDGLWTLPGGYADVGLSAAENVEKEVLEEASLRVKARLLYGVRHKAKHEYQADTRDFYKMLFLCEALDDASPQAGMETLEVGYFQPHALPPLSTGRIIAKDIEAAFAHRDDPQRLTQFD